MPARMELAARGADRRLELAAFLLAAGISASLMAASVAAAYQWFAVSASPLLLPASVVLLTCGVWQGWWLVGLVRNSRPKRPQNTSCWKPLRATYLCVQFWQSLLSGAAVLYLLALGVGPIFGIGWAWLAALAIWQSALLLPIVASPQVTESWRRWMEAHRPGRLNWLVAASVALLALGEGTLRVQGMYRGALFGAGTSETTSSVANTAALDGEMDWSPAFAVDRARFRLALLSDDSIGADTLSKRIQQAVPGAEVARLDVSLAEMESGSLAAELEAVAPDIVLAVLPACSEWAPVSAARSLFDRERFALNRVVFGGENTEKSRTAEAMSDYEAFLNKVSSDLAACRTPIDQAMRERWQRTFAALDGALDTCRAANVPLMLVVVPGEVQLNQGLRTTVLRRNGMTLEQMDVELPQRRLTGYAGQRGVPVVDLLPHLRLCRQAVYARNHTELSERGSIVAASTIGGWLTSRYGDRMSEQLSRNK